MDKHNYIFSSESVTEGHPDKIADQISDSVLDDILSKDANARVACEVLVTTGLTVIAGEITTACYSDVPKIARETIKEIGYNDSSMGFDWETCAVITTIDKQSPDIAVGVNEGTGLFKEQGAGDQGLMFGYACKETPQYMPLPIQQAHNITRRLAYTRHNGILKFLRPDGKSQVSVVYENGNPKFIDTIVVASQHTKDVSYDDLKEGIINEVVKKAISPEYLRPETKYYINPTGRFVVGGPMGDTGLTGRKIIVDTYGGMGRHGGGAFSGKDPSKVDRSSSYMARYIAKNCVAANFADRLEVQLAYAIGIAYPVSVMVNCFGTNKIPQEKIVEAIEKTFPLKPKEIIKHLDLLKPRYKKTASYGHFGRDESEFTWEKLDKIKELQKYL
jgi:S-adenosylmethionine synthetase